MCKYTLWRAALALISWYKLSHPCWYMLPCWDTRQHRPGIMHSALAGVVRVNRCSSQTGVTSVS